MDDDDILVNEFVSMRANEFYKFFYITKVSDDEIYINLLTNYKGDLWDMEYEDEDEEDFDSIEVQKSKMNYVFSLKLQAMNYKIPSKKDRVCI